MGVIFYDPKYVKKLYWIIGILAVALVVSWLPTAMGFINDWLANQYMGF